MTRRQAIGYAAAAVLAAQSSPEAQAELEPNKTRRQLQVNIVTVPDMTQLDVTGPFEVLSRVSGWTVDLVAASMAPVRMAQGLTLSPMTTRENAKSSDILVVPGGSGIDVAMLDPQWVQYVRREAVAARYVFSICTGSLLLAASGVLAGRRAGSHWQARDLLTSFGVTPSNERMTVDGKFYTSGGVTSGVDMALLVVKEAASELAARKIQLAIEYDPAPPFAGGGSPYTSPQEVVSAVLSDSRERRAKREQAVAEAAARLKSAGQ
jgi:cyclohexyl-isocyanide hydratase